MLCHYLFKNLYPYMPTTNANKMSKADLVAKVATDLSISKVQAEKYLNTTLEAIVDLVCQGYDVKLTGFGTFYKATRKPRDGVNPKTKEKIKIAGYQTAGFKVGKNFKDMVKASKK